MNVLILNASPKRKGGASRCFSELLKFLLLGCKITTADIHGQADYSKALSLLGEADAVVVSAPLYVDGIPAHMLPFLQEAEQICRQKHLHFKLYVLSNSGFVEGVHNKLHLNMYEAWCRRSGIEWGGGLGVGGGVMLQVMFVLFPITVLIRCAQIAATVIVVGAITGREVWSLCSGILITGFFLSGALICEIILAHAIRTGHGIKNLYTRVLVPSFIFLICADIFMFLSALFHKTAPHALFRKISSAEIDERAAWIKGVNICQIQCSKEED